MDEIGVRCEAWIEVKVSVQVRMTASWVEIDLRFVTNKFVLSLGFKSKECAAVVKRWVKTYDQEGSR